MRSGRVEEATELVRQTLARPGISQGHAARLAALQARALAMLGDVDDATRMADAALSLAQEAGDALAIGYATGTLVSVVRRSEPGQHGHSRSRSIRAWPRSVTTRRR